MKTTVTQYPRSCANHLTKKGIPGIQYKAPFPQQPQCKSFSLAHPLDFPSSSSSSHNGWPSCHTRTIHARFVHPPPP